MKPEGNGLNAPAQCQEHTWCQTSPGVCQFYGLSVGESLPPNRLCCIMASDSLKLQPVDMVSESSESPEPEAMAFWLCFLKTLSLFWHWPPVADACIQFFGTVAFVQTSYRLTLVWQLVATLHQSKAKCASLEIRFDNFTICQMSDVTWKHFDPFWLWASAAGTWWPTEKDCAKICSCQSKIKSKWLQG